MNNLIIIASVLFLTSGCTKVSDYVSTIVAEITKEEEPKQKTVPGICPPEKPNVQVIEGKCEGDWSFSYHADSKVYTCSYKHKETITCPAGAVSIGQPSGCGGQIDQHTKDSVLNTSKCEKLFSGAVQSSYRLICCS